MIASAGATFHQPKAPRLRFAHSHASAQYPMRQGYHAGFSSSRRLARRRHLSTNARADRNQPVDIQRVLDALQNGLQDVRSDQSVSPVTTPETYGARAEFSARDRRLSRSNTGNPRNVVAVRQGTARPWSQPPDLRRS